jgi:hypothetical protein
MFIVNFLKLLFFIAFIYMLYNLIRFMFGLGRAFRERHAAEQKKAQQNLRGEGGPFRRGNRKEGKDTIELDRDQYKVE